MLWCHVYSCTLVPFQGRTDVNYTIKKQDILLIELHFQGQSRCLEIWWMSTMLINNRPDIIYESAEQEKRRSIRDIMPFPQRHSTNSIYWNLILKVLSGFLNWPSNQPTDHVMMTIHCKLPHQGPFPAFLTNICKSDLNFFSLTDITRPCQYRISSSLSYPRIFLDIQPRSGNGRPLHTKHIFVESNSMCILYLSKPVWSCIKKCFEYFHAHVNGRNIRVKFLHSNFESEFRMSLHVRTACYLRWISFRPCLTGLKFHLFKYLRICVYWT